MKLKYLVVLSLASSASVQSQITTECSSSAADADGDGYGWENGASCIVVQATITSDSECIDSPPIGDGWGWDGTGSCRVFSDSFVDLNPDSAAECVDSPPIGDGWGWNGTDSCQVVPQTEIVIDNSTVLSACLIDNSLLDAENMRLRLQVESLNGTSNQGGTPDYTNTIPTCTQARNRILASVEVGMIEADVRRLVGKPISTTGSTGFYSHNWYVSSVSFDDGFVRSYSAAAAAVCVPFD